MKIAVVTPYYLEDIDIISRCYASVRKQMHPADMHLFVADGHVNTSIAELAGVEHISLPRSHKDAGATPRAIGAISAFSIGYDAVSFLDADNTYQPSHLLTMAAIMSESNAAVVTATRNICTESGDLLYVDTIESTGIDFCDTNCMFLGRPTMNLLTYWITEPAARLWSDRRFWSAIIGSNITRAHCPDPTVNYHSRWAWHYQQAGKSPPDSSVWINVDDTGNLIHQHHVSK